MKFFLSIFALTLTFCGSACKAQSAISSSKDSKSLQYTVSNSSGFSIKNNGSLDYKGPLNTFSKPVKSPPSSVLQVKNSSYRVPESLIESIINENSESNTLSPELKKATVLGGKRPRRITLSYTSTVPSVISIKLRETFETQEIVNSQSLSIFPSAFPSSF